MEKTALFQKNRPMVRRSDGFIIPWDRRAIVKQLLEETKLAEEFYEVQRMSVAEAEKIAKHTGKEYIRSSEWESRKKKKKKGK